MSESWAKYIAKQSPEVRAKLARAAEKIRDLDLENLDIKKLKGAKTLYRCRVGKFRIIFEMKGDFVKLIGIDNRGNSYQSFFRGILINNLQITFLTQNLFRSVW